MALARDEVAARAPPPHGQRHARRVLDAVLHHPTRGRRAPRADPGGDGAGRRPPRAAGRAGRGQAPPHADPGGGADLAARRGWGGGGGCWAAPRTDLGGGAGLAAGRGWGGGRGCWAVAQGMGATGWKKDKGPLPFTRAISSFLLLSPICQIFFTVNF